MSRERKVIVRGFGGGLGNLLLMYFAGYALAKTLDAELWFQNDYIDLKRGNISQFAHLLEHARFVSQREVDALPRPVFEHVEMTMAYSDLPTPSRGHVRMQGYFQSFKYFEHVLLELRDSIFRNVTCTGGCVCVHVRRGDYLHFPEIHPTLPESYYERAMNLMRTRLGTPRFKVFSDDIEYVKNCPAFLSPDVHVQDEPDPERALMHMAACDHFIIANSTLSLCAYHLRANRATATLVAPSRWFGPQGPSNHCVQDLVPPEAILL